MVASSSVSNPTPTIDWADDTDDEIDFGAPVFSDDEDLHPALTRGLGSTSPLPAEDHDHNRSELQNDQDRTPTQPSHRYTAGFADGSNRSLDRKTHNGSALQPMSSRTRTGDRSSPYHDAPNSHFDRASSTNHHSSGARGSGNSFERESHWRSDSRRDNSSLGSSSYGSPRSNGGSHWGKHTDDRGTGSGQRSARQVIPLPPKPPAALDANNPHINRSRSPSYRSHSPLPGTEHRRDNPRLRESSPYSDTHRSFSPSAIPPSGLSTRSRSPGRHSKAHMDQLSPPRDHSKWRSRDNALESRWEKTPHEDKPYPSLPPSLVSSSPKDDVIYFRRRDGRTNEPSNVERTTSGTMYHERLDHNDSRRHRVERTESSSDRWEKNTTVEPDRPYPERAHPPHNSGISSGGGHAKAKPRGQTDTAPVNHSSQHEKSSQRGNRGKGKDQQKRQSKDQQNQPETNTDDGGSTTPWWEQSTYGKSKMDESKSESALQSTKESIEHKHINTPRTGTKEPVETVPKSKKSAETTPEESEVPWWEQSTYKVKPKNSSVDQVSSGLANVSLSRSDSASEQRGDETIARRKALGKVTPASGVEALTLVSREGDATGSSHSLKSRSVQEQVFSEIKEMISNFESQYGRNKLEPIPPRSQQAEAMDKILESFRKLREGLFATETRDIFAAEVYQQSVLSSLYAGNIPELTKALYHLVQEIHPVVYKQTGTTFIPIERQRFLGLYILHNFAKPVKGNDPQSLAIAKPRTETDRLVVSLLNVYEQHQRCVLLNSSQSQAETGGAKSSILGPELLFPLAYWKSLRDGNWIRRERLLSQTQPKDTASWEQRLMIRHAMGDPLRSARTLTVATMSKAYYSLPITAVARSVGLTELHGDLQATEADGANSQLHKKLQSSYGLATSIIMRDGQLLFKAKS